MRPVAAAVGLFAAAWANPAAAQAQAPCHVLCAPHVKVEPAVTFGNLFGAPRVVDDRQHVSRDRRESSVEVVVALGMPTRWPWLEVTAEAIVQPFARDGTPELELEANLVWLPSRVTRGWVSSHVDIVDKYSPAERPSDQRAYTHKLNLEADTSVAIFNWLPEGRWLRDVELEVSLDYVATGLAKRGDLVDIGRLLDDASPWSASLVVVLPLAPL
jgi:hypothetical protein